MVISAGGGGGAPAIAYNTNNSNGSTTVAAGAETTLQTVSVTVGANDIVDLWVFAQVRASAIAAGALRIKRDGVELKAQVWHNQSSSGARLNPAIHYVEKPGAGTYSYTLTGSNDAGSAASAIYEFRKLEATEWQF